MKFSRMTAAVTLASALVMTACSGGDTPDDDNAGASAEATAGSSTATGGPDADAATSSADGPDAATSSADGPDAAVDDDTTAEMTTDEDRAALTVDEAETAAAEVLDARLAALKADGKKAQRARAKAFAQSARTVEAGADRTESVFGKPSEAKARRAAEPNVLAISRDDGEAPVVLLVQTVPSKDEAPVLHLMESRSGDPEDFRITWEAPMLPGTELPVFDRRSVGSPLLREGSGDLKASPNESLEHLAASLTWPRDEEIAEYRTHGYGPAVRRANNEQAQAVRDQADLKETNRLIGDRTTTLLFEDGSAFVTGTLSRLSTFTVKPNSVLNPPESFRVFSDDGELTEEAVMRTMVMVGLRVPSEDVEFKPELIAAREQLVEASGS